MLHLCCLCYLVCVIVCFLLFVCLSYTPVCDDGDNVVVFYLGSEVVKFCASRIMPKTLTEGETYSEVKFSFQLRSEEMPEVEVDWHDFEGGGDAGFKKPAIRDS